MLTANASFPGKEHACLVTATNPLKNTFDAVYCINLDHRTDRWERFEKRIPVDWPFAEIQRVSAVDGKKVPPPSWWKMGGGAWGCYRSHLRLIENALNRGMSSILLLEDDAVFDERFTEKVTTFFNAVPNDWGMVYLGGQHLFVKASPPQVINEHVLSPYNVNRTHAFGLRGQALKEVYRHLCKTDWHPRHHIDHHLGIFHQSRSEPVYCPTSWLVGQGDGHSNICGRVVPERFWSLANTSESENVIKDDDFIAVLGLHSSGSSCLAGVLYHMGIHLGNKLTGFYGNSPEDNQCGFEAHGLMQICEDSIPFPAIRFHQDHDQITRRLRIWIHERKKEAVEMKTLAGGKYPMLCQLGKPLLEICGEKLKVICADRPIQHSIRSLKRRFPKRENAALESHQRWLEMGKRWLLNQLPDSQKMVIAYDALLRDPIAEAVRISHFLGRSLNDVQRDKILSWVDRGKQHIKT